MFEDDLVHGSLGEEVQDARDASRKVDKVMKLLCATLNEDKSVYTIIGSKKQEEKIAQQFELSPLMCGSVKIKYIDAEKWLGRSRCPWAGWRPRWLSLWLCRSLKLGLEIAAIVNDWRSEAVGGI